jgi:hypothetical protein
MRSRALLLVVLWSQCMLFAVIIDRIAIIVGNSVIKDSDIDRDIRITGFLDAEPLDFSAAARKASAGRLVDQVFIRREIRIGDYPTATLQEADQQLAALRKQRYRSNQAFQEALQRYRLSDLDLRAQFQWQLTVLRFIDARFKPAVLLTDEEIDKYRREHAAALAREHPNAPEEELRSDIRDVLTGERVNKLFFAWLDQQRQDTKIQYREENLT